MRRLTTTFLFMVACLCVFPQRADAYFWEWLDSLSGPKFRGFSVEWRAICFTDGLLKSLLAATDAEATQARLALEMWTANKTGDQVTDATRRAIDVTLKRVEAATKANYFAKLAAGPPAPAPEVAFTLVTAAVAWQRVAQARAVEVVDAARGDTASVEVSALETRARQAQSEVDAAQIVALAGPIPFGVIVSACPVNTIDRRRGSLDLNVAWGADTKNDNNKMVMVGPSFSLRVYDWLDVGVAGGVAWFSSVEYKGFTKFYVEPAIVDVRVVALASMLGRDKDKRPPRSWTYVPVLRYTMLTFPGGFARNSFGNGQAYGAEVVHQLGLHVDLEPLFHNAGRLK
jgi:hypothetical protein